MFKTLIVEDSASFRQFLVAALSTRFPQIVIAEAADKAAAIKQIETSTPDLVFMDIKVPGSNGLELTKLIKQAHPEIWVIIVTNYVLPEYREAARDAGANCFLSKTATTVDKLVAIVEKSLAQKGIGSSRSVPLEG